MAPLPVCNLRYSSPIAYYLNNLIHRIVVYHKKPKGKALLEMPLRQQRSNYYDCIS